jgi:hypothetical protein
MQLHRGFVSVLGLAILLTFSLLIGHSARSVGAQDAMGTPAADMGNCVEALGIGEEGNACVNIIHASPDAPAVDVYVNGEMALGDLAFGTASGWVALPAGDHTVQVTAAGEDLETAVIEADVTLDEGAAYEVAATGLLADIAPQIYQVDLSEFEDDGEATARIRIVHASPDAPEVDIAVTDGDVLVSELVFPDASDYIDVPADSYDLEVRVAGTEDVALDLPGVELDAGMVYSVYAIGLVEDGSLTVLPIVATTTGETMGTPTS